jgi:hypothetical protein
MEGRVFSGGRYPSASIFCNAGSVGSLRLWHVRCGRGGGVRSVLQMNNALNLRCLREHVQGRDRENGEARLQLAQIA